MMPGEHCSCRATHSLARAERRSLGVLLVLFLTPYLINVQAESTNDGSLEQKHSKSVKANNEEDAAKRQMLNLLGLHDLPRPAPGVIPHKYLFQIYDKMSRKKSNYRGINTVRGFTDIGLADRWKTLKFHQIYSFNISALLMSEKLKSAKLRILRLPDRRSYRYAWAHGFQHRAKLYYKKTTDHMWNGRIFAHTQLTLLGSVLFDVRNHSLKWQVFNVLEALRKWQNHTDQVHTFELQIESVKTGYLMPSYEFGFSEVGRKNHHKALLVSFTDDERESFEEIENEPLWKTSGNVTEHHSETKEKSRVKRHTRRRRRKRKGPLCHRRDLYVDFTVLGWSEYIVAPRVYNAYYCHGLCKYPIPEHLKPTNHAVVQTTVNLTVKKSQIPPACCVPHKLSGASILSVDRGNSFVYRQYQNMVVESCGCK